MTPGEWGVRRALHLCSKPSRLLWPGLLCVQSSAQGGANVDLEGEGRAAYGAITLDDLGPGGMLTDDAFMFQVRCHAEG